MSEREGQLHEQVKGTADMSYGSERASDYFGAERIFHDEQELHQHGRASKHDGAEKPHGRKGGMTTRHNKHSIR